MEILQQLATEEIIENVAEQQNDNMRNSSNCHDDAGALSNFSDSGKWPKCVIVCDKYQLKKVQNRFNHVVFQNKK